MCSNDPDHFAGRCLRNDRGENDQPNLLGIEGPLSFVTIPGEGWLKRLTGESLPDPFDIPRLVLNDENGVRHGSCGVRAIFT